MANYKVPILSTISTPNADDMIKFNGTDWVPVAGIESRILVVESEAASNDSEILLLESECNNISEALSQTDSRVLVLESEMSAVEAGAAWPNGPSLASCHSATSKLLTAVDSQLLLIESEAASNDSEILLLESECSAIRVDITKYVQRGNLAVPDFKTGDWSPVESGTATSTSANHLVDSAATFETNGVVVGDYVYNTTDSTWATVTAVNSEIDLTLDADIMVNGEGYYVGNFKTDGNWYDLDLSGIIPVGTIAVGISLYIADNAANKLIQFKDPDHADNQNVFGYRTQVANVANDGAISFVGVDSNRNLKYNAADTSWGSIQIRIVSWIIPG